MHRIVAFLALLALSIMFLPSLSRADLLYPGLTSITALGGSDYRIYSTAPSAYWVSTINYGKTIGKFIVEPGNITSNLRGNPNSGIPIGYGWATNYTLQGPIPAGVWTFSRSMISNKNNVAYLGFVVYKTCNGLDTYLFSTFGGRDVTDGSGVVKVYVYNYSAPHLDVTGCYLKLENWLNVTSADASSLASFSIIGDSNSWIKFPNVLDITPPTYDFNSTSSFIAGINVLHSLYLQDNIQLSGYIFSFDNGTGTFVNDSFIQLPAKTGWANVTKKITSVPGATIRWCVYVNDTSNNWNDASCLNPFTYVAVQSPYIDVQERVREFVVTQNQTFTVDIIFRNTGGIVARNVSINYSIPSEIKVVSGDTNWTGQLSPDEGDGITFIAMSYKRGYLDLGSTTASYKDDMGLIYQTSSPKTELYVQAPLYVQTVSPFSSPSTFFYYLQQNISEVQFLGVIVGIVASIYSIYRVVTRSSTTSVSSRAIGSSETAGSNKISESIMLSSREPFDLMAIRSCRKILRVLFDKEGLTLKQIEASLNRSGKTKSGPSAVSDILPILVKTGMLKEVNYRYYLDRKTKKKWVREFLNLLIKERIDRGKIIPKK